VIISIIYLCNLFKGIYSQGFLMENTWFMVREDEVHKRDPL
jgi:hypothetical protein